MGRSRGFDIGNKKEQPIGCSFCYALNIFATHIRKSYFLFRANLTLQFFAAIPKSQPTFLQHFDLFHSNTPITMMCPRKKLDTSLAICLK